MLSPRSRLLLSIRFSKFFVKLRVFRLKLGLRWAAFKMRLAYLRILLLAFLIRRFSSNLMNSSESTSLSASTNSSDLTSYALAKLSELAEDMSSSEAQPEVPQPQVLPFGQDFLRKKLSDLDR
jgi:hypothetical protein